MATLHDPVRWHQLPLAQQLANIGSEVSRYAAWAVRENGVVQRDAAAQRALELLDLTIGDARWVARGHELVQLREVCRDVFGGSGAYDVTVAELEAYLLPFALLSRRV